MLGTKLPDAVLQKLKCFACGSFLSMAPVSVQFDGNAICSHCNLSSISPSRNITRCFVYEEIASLFLFPCRYQNQGCLRLLPFNKSEEHENQCTYHVYTCPVNTYSSCTWKGSLYLLCDHYESDHPDLYLKDSNYKISIKSGEVHKLFKIFDVLFLMQVKLSVVENKMWFNVVYFGNINDASCIQYSIRLNGDNNDRVLELGNRNHLLPFTNMKLQPSESLKINLQALLDILKYPKSIHCHCTVTIVDPLKNRLNLETVQSDTKIYNSKEILICRYCRISLTAPIFRCPEDHITCIDCKGFESNCADCEMNGVEFTRAYDLEHLMTSVMYHCKWKTCNGICNYDEIRKHEQECTQRLFKCPSCNKSIGLLPNVIEHFQKRHIDINFIYESGPSYTLNLDAKTQDLLLFIKNEFFRVEVIRYNTGGHFYAKVVISHFVSARRCQDFKCQVTNNQKGLLYNFDGWSNPYIVTEHILKDNFAKGISYFTLDFNLNEWIMFEYPFANKNTTFR